MNQSFQTGNKLVLELINSDEILEGEYVDGSKERITLINIHSYNSKRVIKGPYCYYRSDISSIKLLNGCDNEPGANCNIRNGHDVLVNCDIIALSKFEYERLKAMSHDYIYINTIDSRYYDAVGYIKNCETIGVSCITTSYEKTADLNLLIISTWDQVYILDFVTLNISKFPPELKEILESKYLKKVLHDSRLFTEILAKRFNVNLTNIFDTKVADIAVRKKKGEVPECTKSLQECLVHYFNLPNTVQELTLDKWKKRPLSDLKKLRSARIATFLITLKNHLEKLLLEEFYKSVDDYSRSLTDCCMMKVPEKLFDKKLCNILNNIKLL